MVIFVCVCVWWVDGKKRKKKKKRFDTRDRWREDPVLISTRWRSNKTGAKANKSSSNETKYIYFSSEYFIGIYEKNYVLDCCEIELFTWNFLVKFPRVLFIWKTKITVDYIIFLIISTSIFFPSDNISLPSLHFFSFIWKHPGKINYRKTFHQRGKDFFSNILFKNLKNKNNSS